MSNGNLFHKRYIPLAIFAAIIAIFGLVNPFSAGVAFADDDTDGSITILTVSDPAGATGFNYTASFGSFTQDDGDSFLQSGLFEGSTYAIFQDIPAGFELDITCTGAEATEPIGSNGINVTLDDDGDAICTFTNSQVGASLTVVTASDPAGATGFDYFGTNGTFTQDDGQQTVYENLVPGSYDIFQNIPAGFELSIDCVGASNVTPQGADGVLLDLAANEDAVCTFTNSDVGGSVTVVAASDPAGLEDIVFFSSFGTFTLTHGASTSFSSLLPGDYDVFQTIPAGYILDIDCDAAASSQIGDNGVLLSVSAGEDVTCTFTNTDVAGSVTVVNAADSDTSATFDYVSSLSSFTLGAGESTTFDTLLPGDYDFFQSIPAGYVLDIACVGGDSEAIGSNGVKAMLDANEDITCTFTNTYVGGSITLINNVVADEAVSVDIVGAFGDVTLDDGESTSQGDLLPGDYTFFQTIPAGFTLDIDCVGGDSTPFGDNGVTVNLDANEDVTCTLTNTDVGGSITVVADSTPAGLTDFNYYGNIGAFMLDDDGSFTASDLLPGNYDIVQDTVAGLDLTITCEGGDSSPLGGNAVTVNLDANEDITCTFSNVDPNYNPNLIVNGDFEAGQDNGWEEWSYNNYDIIVDEDAYGGTVPPQSGEYLAWLGGGSRERSYLWQYIDVPADQNTTLDFSFWTESVDYCGYDWAALYIRDGEEIYNVWSYSNCYYNNTNGWVDASVDISQFAGKNVKVMFYSYDDYIYYSSMFVDDVSTSSGSAPLAGNTINANTFTRIEADASLSDAEMMEQFIEDQIIINGQDPREDAPAGGEEAEDRVDLADPTAVEMASVSLETASTVPSIVSTMLVALSALTGIALGLRYKKD